MEVPTSPSGPSFREFVDYIKWSAVMIGKTFTEPDDDWRPHIYVHDNAGVHPVGVNPQWFASDERKDNLANNIIVPKLVETKARKFALLISTWAITVEELEETGQRPLEHPDRREQLHLEVLDAEREEMWFAPVFRDGEQPPALSDWIGPSLEGASRFSIPIREALR